jgi:hypothetical protein
MADVVSFLLLMGYAAAYSVAALAWIFAMGNLFRVVAFRRSGVPLWSAELVYFPFTLVFRPELLTERGRQSRRRFGIAAVVFLGALVLGLALGTLK